MDYDEMQSYFEDLGFEIADFDGEPFLFIDLSDLEEYGLYALVTDMAGNIPKSLDEPIIWSLFDNNDTLQWSVSIKNASYLKKLFVESDSLEDIINSLKNLREYNILEADPYFHAIV